jgi:hypothetical protein
MADKLQKLTDLLNLLQNDTITPKQLEQFLNMLVGVIKQVSDGFKTLSAQNIQTLQDGLAAILTQHADILTQIDERNQRASGATQAQIDQLSAMLTRTEQIQAIPGPAGKDGESIVGSPGPAGKDGSPDTGEQIVEKINELPTDDDDLKIDFAHIKGAPQAVSTFVRQGGFRNLQIFDENTLLTKAVQFMKFAGAGVQATISRDGVVTVTIPGGGGSSATAVDEAATDSGNHTTFTISHTPNASTLLVINENTGQAVPASAYTNTTTSIIFNSSQQVDDGAGNLVTPTFRARYFY